jgi:hypothetical protein
VPQITGDLAITRGDTVQSYRSDSVYYVGSLSVWKRLWFHLSQHVVLFALVSLAIVVVVAMLLYGSLQRRVAGRPAANDSP